jgi:hypothetical protein
MKRSLFRLTILFTLIIPTFVRAQSKRLRQPIFPQGQAWHFRDDMYFGDSRESVGVQKADICTFFIAKHDG